jgi:hypothetical protein
MDTVTKNEEISIEQNENDRKVTAVSFAEFLKEVSKNQHMPIDSLEGFYQIIRKEVLKFINLRKPVNVNEEVRISFGLFNLNVRCYKDEFSKKTILSINIVPHQDSIIITNPDYYGEEIVKSTLMR